MNNYQDEQPEQEWHPRIILHEPFEKVMGLGGFSPMLRMYSNPYEPFIFASDWLGGKQWVATIARLIVAGMVTTMDGGFQLTTDGHWYFHHYYSAMKARREQAARRDAEIERLFPRDEWDEWHGGDFDLLDF